MKLDTFFIVNALLLVALVAGATYLQKTYDTDKSATVSVSEEGSIAATDNSNGWHISTSTAPTTVRTTPAPVVKKTPAPAVHRVYNDDDGPDDN